MATTLPAQNTMNPTQATVVLPKVFQPKAIRAPNVHQTVAQPQVVQQPQMAQVPNTAAQVIQVPATPGPSTAGNVQNPQGTVRYIRVPAGTTKATYNLRPVTLNNATTVNIPAMVTTTPVITGRGQNNLQTTQVKQEPPTPGNITTPKTTSTTTIVKRGKGRGKKVPTVSVLDTTSEMGEYYIEVTDATELYEILANINDPEIEELEVNRSQKWNHQSDSIQDIIQRYIYQDKHMRQDLFVNMDTMGSAIGATMPTTFGQTKFNVLVDTGAMKSCMSQAYYQQLMLPTTRPIHTYGSNLCPIGITECEFKIVQKEYKNDFVVCKNLIRPCFLGIDFLKNMVYLQDGLQQVSSN